MLRPLLALWCEDARKKEHFRRLHANCIFNILQFQTTSVGLKPPSVGGGLHESITLRSSPGGTAKHRSERSPRSFWRCRTTFLSNPGQHSAESASKFHGRPLASSDSFRFQTTSAILSEFRRNLGDARRTRPDFGQIRPPVLDFGRSWPNAAGLADLFGQTWPGRVRKVGRTRYTFGRSDTSLLPWRQGRTSCISPDEHHARQKHSGRQPESQRGTLS